MTDRSAPRHDLGDLAADCARSTRYHLHRVRFFGFWASALAAFALGAGVAAVVAILSAAHVEGALPFALLALAAQLVSLLVRPVKKAARHRALANDHIALERRIVREGPALDLVRVRDQLLQIEAREPPVYRAVDIIAHNQIASAEGRGEDVCRLTPWERIAANWLAFSTVDWEARRRSSAGI